MATEVEITASQWKVLDTMATDIGTAKKDLNDIVDQVKSIEANVNNVFPKIDTSIGKWNEAIDKVNKDIPFISKEIGHLNVIERNIRNLIIIISAVMTLVAGLVIVVIYNSIKKAVSS